MKLPANINLLAPLAPSVEVESARRAEDWPEPIPFAPCEPDVIPTNGLPGWLGEMAQAAAENTETPFALAALLSVAVTSASIAGKAVISPEPGYSEPVNLYMCPAMESGNRKTAVLNLVLSPFIDWERDRRAQIEPERRRLTSRFQTDEARIARLRKKAAAAVDPSQFLAQIEELEMNLPVIPVLPRLFTDDCTPEQLAPLMAEQGERMAVFSDEGGIFDLLAGRYSKGIPNLDLWLKAHSVSPVRVDRRTQPPILMDRPHLTVGISPQPDVLESLRDKPGFRGRGLLARFLYGLPKSPLGHRELEPWRIPADTMERYRAGICQLLDFQPESAVELRLSASAYQEWKSFQRALEIEFRDGGKLEGLNDWGSKLAGAALRLAGVFHFVGPAGRMCIDTEINRDTMTLALDFGACMISHAQAVFALMRRDPNLEHCEKLVSWLVRQGKSSFTIRDCFRAHQARFKRMDVMAPVLVLLEQHGYIRRELRESSGGRPPSDVCEVNPAVLNKAGAP